MDGIECVSRFRKAESRRTSSTNLTTLDISTGSGTAHSPTGGDGLGPLPTPRQLIVGCSANGDSATHIAAVEAGI